MTSLAQHTRVVRLAHSKVSGLCSSGFISTRNHFLCMRNDKKETAILWSIGKQMGLTCREKEKEVIDNMVELKIRDKEETDRETKKGCAKSL